MPLPARVIIVSRELLLESNQQPRLERIEQLLTGMKSGDALVLLASQPERWQPSRRNVDQDLSLQQVLKKLLNGNGIVLDGIWYVEHSLWGKRRQRRKALEKIAGRYRGSQAILVSGNELDIAAGTGTDIKSVAIFDEKSFNVDEAVSICTDFGRLGKTLA